jgi:hypothetical protein
MLSSKKSLTHLLLQIIAEAIEDADNSWFREDYDHQARKVIATLERRGFFTVPMRLSDRAIEKSIEDLPYGRLLGEDYVRQTYEILVRNSAKY